MDGLLEALERLSRLRETGALTDEEFLAEKSKILHRRDGDHSSTGGTIVTLGSSTEPRRWLSSKRGGSALAVTGAVLVALGSWLWFSPYLTLRAMKVAIEQRDAKALSNYIDFPALRSDLKADALAEITQRMKASEGGGADGLGLLGAAMIGPLIDGMISPEGLPALLATKSPKDDDFGLTRLASGKGQVVRTGLSEFSFKQPGGGALVFKLNGLHWQLSGVDTAPLKNASAVPTTLDRAKPSLGPVFRPLDDQASAGSSSSIEPERASFNQTYLVGSWVQSPGDCSNPDDQTVILQNGMSSDGTASHKVQSPTRLVVGSDGETTFAISAVTPNSFTSIDLDPSTPKSDKVWHWVRCH